MRFTTWFILLGTFSAHASDIINVRDTLELSSVIGSPKEITIEFVSSVPDLKAEDIEVSQVKPTVPPGQRAPRYEKQLEFKLKKVAGAGRTVSNELNAYVFWWDLEELAIKSAMSVRVTNPVIVPFDPNAKDEAEAVPPVPLKPDLPPVR